MADYAELVKKLRNRRVCLQTGLNLDNDYPLLREAADAIEQLSTELECLKSYMGEYKAAYIAEHDARMMEYRSRKEGTCPFIVCHDCKYRGIEAKMETWPCMDCCDGDRHEAVKRNAPREET